MLAEDRQPGDPAPLRCHLGGTRDGHAYRLYRLAHEGSARHPLLPPAGGGGVQRPLKLATHLPELGIETHVLAPDDPQVGAPRRRPAGATLAWVHRVRFIGPRGRKPAEELYGTAGLERYARQASLFGRRLLVPDENVSFNLTAIPAAIRIVRQEGIDVVVTDLARRARST